MVYNESFQPSLFNGNSHQVPSQWQALPSPLPTNVEEESLNLPQLLSTLRRRWWLLTAVGVTVTAIMAGKVLNEEARYTSGFQLLIEPIAGEQNTVNQALAEQAGLASRPQDYETLIQVLQSSQVLSPVIKIIQSQYPDVTYASLIQNLSITRFRDTTILDIRYQDSDPQKVQFVLEQLAQNYIGYSLMKQQSSSQQGLQFVEQQLPLLQQRVDKLQEKLQKFRQHYNLIDPQAQGQILSDRYSSILQQQQENQAELGETQALYVTLQRQVGLDLNQAVAAAALSEAPRYQALLTQLKDVETQVAVESARFTSNSPTIQTLLEQRQNLLYLVRQEALSVLGTSQVSGNVQALAASPNPIRLEVTQNLLETTNKLQIITMRQQALSLAENQLRQQLQQMAGIVRQYADLQRELEVATESLNRFLGVRENLQIEAAQKEMPWQLISEIQEPQQPVSPNVPRGLLLGGVAGILAGVGAALLADKVDNKFHSPEELKEATGLPLLGTVPFNKEVVWDRNKEQQEPLPTLFGRYRVSPYVEAFRSLHTNLYFLSPDKPLKTLVLSSSMPMEGKSTTSVHLARAAAALGQRVLLIDADLRCPQVHRLVDLPNVWGLSHVISTEMDVNDVIQRSPNTENLYILTAGQIPPDPVRLLSSKKMQSLVQFFRQSFDLVIFDTPPMLGMADAKLLSQHTDGMVMVVGLGQSDKHAVHQALDSLKMSQTTLLGIVANGVKRYSSSAYNYYSYQRYYWQPE